jgi:hypothetical protein
VGAFCPLSSLPVIDVRFAAIHCPLQAHRLVELSGMTDLHELSITLGALVPRRPHSDSRTIRHR